MSLCAKNLIWNIYNKFSLLCFSTNCSCVHEIHELQTSHLALTGPRICFIKRVQTKALLQGLWVPLFRHQAQSWVQKVSWCSCFPLMLKLTSQPTFLANFINSQTLWYCLLLLCRKLSTLSIPRRKELRSVILLLDITGLTLLWKITPIIITHLFISEWVP